MDKKAPIPTRKTLLGVPYDHYRMADGADLYVTPFGRPFLRHLWPDNWLEPEWFGKSREALQGTSTVYKIKTKPVAGASKDIVVKWCRMGEDVPMDTFTRSKFIETDFNSPYEEFSLLMEMRARARPGTIRTHKPLAIFVPAKRLELWQTGRSKSKIDYKKAKFGVRLTQNAKLLHIIAATLTNRNIPSSQDGTCGLYGSLRVRRATGKRVEIRLFWRGTRRRLAGDPWLSSILAASLSGSRRTC